MAIRNQLISLENVSPELAARLQRMLDEYNERTGNEKPEDNAE